MKIHKCTFVEIARPFFAFLAAGYHPLVRYSGEIIIIRFQTATPDAIYRWLVILSSASYRHSSDQPQYANYEKLLAFFQYFNDARCYRAYLCLLEISESRPSASITRR